MRKLRNWLIMLTALVLALVLSGCKVDPAKKEWHLQGYIKNTANKTSFQKKMNLESFRNRYCFTYKYPACHWAEVLLKKKYPSEF